MTQSRESLASTSSRIGIDQTSWIALIQSRPEHSWDRVGITVETRPAAHRSELKLRDSAQGFIAPVFPLWGIFENIHI